MGKPRPSKNHGKRGRNSAAEKVGENVRQCGRWVLRQTKIRQARASEQITCKPPATKDLTKKRKRPSQTVLSEATSEGSCVGENQIPVPAILKQNRGCILVSSHKDMLSSSRHAFWQPDGRSSSDEDEILIMEMLESSSESFEDSEGNNGGSGGQ